MSGTLPDTLKGVEMVLRNAWGLLNMGTNNVRYSARYTQEDEMVLRNAWGLLNMGQVLCRINPRS